jgi:YD repeat-containing protein
VKQVSFTYDQYNNVLNQKEYDWGSGAAGGLLRETRNTYVTSANYTGLNLVRLPARTTILDGAGNLASDSTYDYDLNYTPGNAICTAGVGHDNQNFAGPSPRGNLGRISQYLSTSGSWITTDTRAYDMSGNLTSEADGNNHTTSFSYNDNFPDAHPTTCGFVTGIFNGLGQAVFQAQYDYSLGRPTVTADPTGHYTIHESGTLAFGLDKPARETRAFQTPLENRTNITYNSPTSQVTKQDQNASGDVLVSEQRWDGFGRPVSSIVYEAGGSYIETDTAYDELGRMASVTNPWRGGDTPVRTTYGYDALGRQTSVTAQDGIVTTTTSYSGNTTTVTDEASKAKKLTYDGLGRLTNVLEDPGGWNVSTNYIYTATTTTVTSARIPIAK